jgi:hypothetical protein
MVVVPEILMLLGVVIWGVGELVAVIKGHDETSSDYVTKGRKYRAARWAIYLVLTWAVLHLGLGLPAGLFFGGD